jgi:iron complex transport system ATP-binding protein
MEVRLENLSFQAAGKKILDRINLVVRGRKMIGLLGPNGSGKTSLLRHIHRECPSRGAVFVNGKDLAVVSRKELAKEMAVLTQQMDQIDRTLTVEEIVSLGRYPRKSFLQSYDSADASMVDRLLKANGLDDLRDQTLDTLSGGETQHAMLAKALAQEPRMLILDEPTNHLDVKYRVELMNFLKTFPGLVLITLHDLSLAANYCDYLYFLKEGRMCGEGVPAEICTDVFLSEVFEAPFKVLRTPGLVIYVQPETPPSGSDRPESEADSRQT